MNRECFQLTQLAFLLLVLYSGRGRFGTVRSGPELCLLGELDGTRYSTRPIELVLWNSLAHFDIRSSYEETS